MRKESAGHSAFSDLGYSLSSRNKAGGRGRDIIRQGGPGIGTGLALSRGLSLGALGARLGGAYVATKGITFSTQSFKQFAYFQREMTRIGITVGATAKEIAEASRLVENTSIELALPKKAPLRLYRPWWPQAWISSNLFNYCHLSWQRLKPPIQRHRISQTQP